MVTQPRIRRRSRLIELIRGGWGAMLFLVPHVVLERSLHVRADHRAIVVTRILGARHLTQAALSGLRPSADVLAMGVWVDTVHAATALALAAADRPRTRAGLIDTGVATSWALIGYRDLNGETGVAGLSRQRRRDRLARRVLDVVPGGPFLLDHAHMEETNHG